MPSVEYRQGSGVDNEVTYRIFLATVMDLGQRTGTQPISGGHDPAVIQRLWEKRAPLIRHLTETANQFWVAELDGQVVAYARSLMRDDVWELSDFFVLPEAQSLGIGRNLFERAAPPEGTRHRVIIATTDVPATVRYLKSGVYPRFPIQYFYRKAEKREINTDLIFEPLSASLRHLKALNQIDRQIIGYTREVDHTWLMANRQGFLVKRRGEALGYGYVGESSGPFALLAPHEFPDVLAYAENIAAEQDLEFGLETPLHNRHAVDVLLERGFKLDRFLTHYMSDAPLGQYENYIFTSPPFFA